MTDAVAAMLDREQIRDLAQRYAIAITSRDLDALVELFDPAVDNGKWGKGRDGTRSYYADYFERNQRNAFLQVGTHQVDLIDESTASGICLTRSWDVSADGSRMDVLVVYFDTYRKQDGRWGFVQRRETLHDIVPGASVDLASQPPMTRPWEYWDRWRERKAKGQLFR